MKHYVPRIHLCDWILQTSQRNGQALVRDVWWQCLTRSNIGNRLCLSTYSKDTDFYEMFSGCGSLYQEFRQLLSGKVNYYFAEQKER